MLKKWIAPLHVCDFTEKLLHYRCRGYYVDTAGKNATKIAAYIQNQLKEDKYGEQLTMLGKM